MRTIKISLEKICWFVLYLIVEGCVVATRGGARLREIISRSSRNGVIAVFLSFSLGLSCQPTGATELDKLIASAKSRFTEIQSARIELRHYEGLVPEETSPDVASVERMLDEFFERCRTGDFDEGVRGMNLLRDQICGMPMEDKWCILMILEQGASVRNTVFVDGELRRNWGYHKGTSVQHHAGLRSAEIDPGKSVDARYSLAYVRPMIVNASWQTVSSESPVADWLYSGELKNVVGITANDEVALIDSETGAMLKLAAPGSVYRFRCLYTDFDGFNLPRLGIDVRMRAGRVRTIATFILNEAELNEPIADADLAVAVPLSTSIQDFRSPNREVRVLADVEGDAIATVNRAIVQGRSQSPPSEIDPSTAANPFIPWFLALNGVLLAVIAYVSWKRQTRRRPE
jgi:hypothetical protein